MISLQAETLEQIIQTCHRLTHVTGWPIRFVPQHTVDGLDVSGDDVVDFPAQCWSMAIGDGDETVGWLQIQLPTDAGRDSTFTPVCDVTALAGDLICDLLKAQSALNRRTSDVATLVDIGMSIGHDPTPVGTIDRLLQAGVDLTGFRSAAFFLLSPAVNQVSLRATASIDRGMIPSPVRELDAGTPDLTALAQGRTIIGRRNTKQANLWLPETISTGYSLPVQSDDGPLGTLWFFDRRARLPEERESTVLQSIAAQMATVLERVVLLEENSQKGRMQRDLQSASNSHVVGTPGELPSGCEALDLAARCSSRFELGGDLCEVIQLSDSRTVIAVGDASGDSVPAAMVMSAVRGALRTLTDPSPGEKVDTVDVMQRLNRSLHQITPAYQFMSLIYGVFDAADNSFTYTNAGHPTPLWFSDGTAISLESHGLLLGIDTDTTYDSSTILLKPDDTLVMFSDGITEVRTGRRQLYGNEGVVRMFGDSPASSAAELLQAIWADVDSYASESDDRTLLVIRVRA